ncbi:formylmethanofuran dehydrogenase subunit C [Thalassoglobus sp. JC818]|uniref:formylmethanofuran dehydrogenase subunit C n=1 Tax=Thalassoglobus sp. JC818 TaxID=3232136 RepID=UPI00345A831C
MPLTFRLHTESSIPLEVDSLKLETLRDQSLPEIEKTEIFRGNQKVPVSEFFDVSGSANEDQTVVWEGNLAKVKLIGAHLTEGTVHVEGNVGMHLGAYMTGGEIRVVGDAADWVGAEMSGGRIHIQGNAGNLLGAVYRGGRKGMRGGEILVEGNVGSEVGHTMRRGLIAIGGNCGDAAGVGMIAGTIFVFGKSGIRNGAGMKRGTIGLFGSGHSPEVLPTFRKANVYSPSFLQLYFRFLSECRFSVPENVLRGPFQRYCGDLLEMGKGEILTLVN